MVGNGRPQDPPGTTDGNTKPSTLEGGDVQNLLHRQKASYGTVVWQAEQYRCVSMPGILASLVVCTDCPYLERIWRLPDVHLHVNTVAQTVDYTLILSLLLIKSHVHPYWTSLHLILFLF